MEYKKEYKGKLVYVKGYGQVDTSKVAADTIKKLSLQPQFVRLAKLIENEKKSEPKGNNK